MTSIYNWTLSAPGNANADNLINWAEGQPPSTVNNSARAMMQRMREFVGDIGGGIMAQGSGNIISLTINSPLSAYANGIVIRFRAMHANSGTVSINVNSLGAKPVTTSSPYGLVALRGGELQPNCLYEILYYSSLYSNTGGWFLTNPTARQAIPAGAISAFGMSSPPQGWLKCDGQLVLRSQYTALFAAVGTIWGGGDGSTTFRLPDLRGMFLRGVDEGRGQDSGRAFASFQDSQNKAHNHGGVTGANGAHSHSYPDHDTVAGQFVNQGTRSWGFEIFNVPRQSQRTTNTVQNHTHTIASEGGAEARPKNIAVIYAIKW